MLKIGCQERMGNKNANWDSERNAMGARLGLGHEIHLFGFILNRRNRFKS